MNTLDHLLEHIRAEREGLERLHGQMQAVRDRLAELERLAVRETAKAYAAGAAAERMRQGKASGEIDVRG